MNSTPTPPADPLSSPSHPSIHPSTSPPTPAPRTDRRPTGKIAQLPKTIRDRLNQMIRDGFTYRQIIKKLGADAKDLNEPNLTVWYQGGYRDWLLRQEQAEAEVAKWEFASDLVRHHDGADIAHAAVLVATKQIHKALADLTPAALQSILQEKPDEYVRLLNALSRLSRETRGFRKDHAQSDAEEAARNPDGADDTEDKPLTPETLAKIERELRLL
jgi:hypothetical protein